MGQADWDPEQYARFAAERAEPFHDLVALVDGEGVERVVDLGCGDGGLTAGLVATLGASDVLGVDSSPAMLARATEHAGPALRFESADIATWEAPGAFDLVLANASLHWVGDHPSVLARWAAALRPGGQLAVQVPANADHPSHRTSTEIASTEPFLSAMGGTPPPDPVAVNVLPPERYAELLHELGAAEQHVRLQVYGHLLDSTADVVQWVRGTSLTRFFAVLPEELHAPFVEAYAARLRERLGDRAPYFYPFKRLLVWARWP